MKKSNHILLGCVADDFTGASDAASFLANQGIKTLLFNGIPEDGTLVEDCAAIVIALKTRSAPAEQAVADTSRALEWLRNHNTEQFYIKYCSTFDSTPQGNIGQNIDVALDICETKYTLICPSLPVNGRMVSNGILYVDGVPVAESHMAKHPLNPIWDSRIKELMRPQGQYPCMVISPALWDKSDEEIMATVEKFAAGKKHFYIVPEYKTDEDGEKITRLFGANSLLTGGSGLLAHLAQRLKSVYDCSSEEPLLSGIKGQALILSGSCSQATAQQCKNYAAEHVTMPIYPKNLLDGTQTVDDLWTFISSHEEDDVLIYSAGATDPSSRKYASKEESIRASIALEAIMAQLGKKAIDSGFTRLIVAGGETSGAVTLALGFNAFQIGESVAPGVPVMIPLHRPDTRIVLKSGNFGQLDFFERALRISSCAEDRTGVGT